jgi:hypothetical protein
MALTLLLAALTTGVVAPSTSSSDAMPVHDAAAWPAAAVTTASAGTWRFGDPTWHAPDTLFQAAAVYASRPPTVDGEVTEEEWGDAPVFKDFIQFEPRRGQPSSVRTEARILYDSAFVYVAFTGWDPEPLTANLTRRDSDLTSDDFFVVLLDTYRDRQSAYVFAVNPLGTQTDTRVAGDGRTNDATWDERWEARARIQDWGWSAEMAIPLSSIRFQPGENRTWGVNFGRGRRRTLELAFWTGPLENPLRVSQAGELRGLNLRPPPSRHLGIVYGLGRVANGQEPFGDAGLDFRYALTPGVTFSGTVNPDFATIEADQEQVNLTRFEVNLPEKRPFFLEGSELFRQRIRTFYSRRVSDIRAGGRVLGRHGPWTFAFLGADAEPEGEHDGAFYGVSRLQRDVGRSSVAMTWADRREDGTGQGSVGMDATLFFSRTLGLTGQVIRSYGPHDEGVWAFFLRPSYDSPTGHFHVRYSHLGERFRDNVNVIGFVQDDDRREVDSALEKTFWLRQGVLERLDYGSNYNVYWSQGGGLRSWTVDESLNAELRSRWSGRIAHTEEFKAEELPRFEKDFRNRSTTLRLGYNTREYQSVFASYRFGRNFDADFYLLSGAARYKPTPESALEYELQRLVLDPDPTDGSTWIHVARANHFVTNDLFLQLFFQTNSAIDRRNVQAVFVYRYRPPFGTFQLAFQRGTAEFGERSEQGNTLFLKATWVF